MPYFENSERTVVRHSVLNDIAHDLNVYNFPNSQEEEKILAALNPTVVEQRGYNVPGCMEGTRKSVFEEIDGWLDDFSAPNILWVSGSPGSGKSGFCALPLGSCISFLLHLGLCTWLLCHLWSQS
jgi:hypothetical protein